MFATTSILRAFGDSRRTTTVRGHLIPGIRRAKRPAAMRVPGRAGASGWRWLRTTPTARAPWPREPVVRRAIPQATQRGPPRLPGTGRTTGELVDRRVVPGTCASSRLRSRCGHPRLSSSEPVHLLPETAALVLFHGEQRRSHRCCLVDGERTRLRQSGAVAGQDVRADGLCAPCASRRATGGAGGEPDGVDRVGHLGGLVDIVDAPDQPPLDDTARRRSSRGGYHRRRSQPARRQIRTDSGWSRPSASTSRAERRTRSRASSRASCPDPPARPHRAAS